MRETPRVAIVALVVLAGCTEAESDVFSYLAFLVVLAGWAGVTLWKRR